MPYGPLNNPCKFCKDWPIRNKIPSISRFDSDIIYIEH